MKENNEYKCTRCKSIFEKTWSDEEALGEMKDNFGEKSLEEPMNVICDDCYNIIMRQ